MKRSNGAKPHEPTMGSRRRYPPSSMEGVVLDLPNIRAPEAPRRAAAPVRRTSRVLAWIRHRALPAETPCTIREQHGVLACRSNIRPFRAPAPRSQPSLSVVSLATSSGSISAASTALSRLLAQQSLPSE